MELRDKNEFCELVQDSKKTMYNIAYRVLRDPEDAKDVVGESIADAYENIDTLRSKENFKSWMASIALSNARTMRKVRNRAKNAEQKIFFCNTIITDSYDELWDVLDELPKKLQDVVHLFYYEGYSYSEISQILQVPVGTVKSRLQRGRDKLKAILEEGNV